MLMVHQRRTHRAINVCMRLSSHASDTEKLTVYISTQCEELDINKLQCFRISICAAEAMNNIIEHACAKSTAHSIRVVMVITAAEITIQFLDSGIHYSPPENKPLELEEESGRGWYILRNWTDQLNYRRQGRINRLTLKFRLDSTPF